MRIELDPSNLADAHFIGAIVEAIRASGDLVKPEPRARPYSVAEAAEETGLSETQIYRLVQAGRLVRIPETWRTLITVESIRKFQEGK